MALAKLGQRLFMNFNRADVIFVVDTEEIPGHRLILAETCAYFEKLLCGEFEESKSKKVPITGTSTKVFKEVIRFIYLGRLEINGWNIDDLLALLSSAHEYQFEQLMDAVKTALIQHPLDLESWALVNSAASLYDSDALKAMCVSFVEMKIDDFVRYKDLEKFTAHFINSMLDSSKVASINQDHLLAAICEWRKHHNSSDISSILSKINWTNISPSISNIVLKDVFSNAKNEKDFSFWTKVAELIQKPQSEVLTRVESVILVSNSNVFFSLEKHQCSIVVSFFDCYLTHYGITVDFIKDYTRFVEIPVKRIEFESATKLNITRIYGCHLESSQSDMIASEHILDNGCFKYITVFSDVTPVYKIKIDIQTVSQLSEIRLQNIVISQV